MLCSHFDRTLQTDSTEYDDWKWWLFDEYTQWTDEQGGMGAIWIVFRAPFKRFSAFNYKTIPTVWSSFCYPKRFEGGEHTTIIINK